MAVYARLRPRKTYAALFAEHRPVGCGVMTLLVLRYAGQMRLAYFLQCVSHKDLLYPKEREQE